MHLFIDWTATPLADIPQVGELLAGIVMDVDKQFA
jgi:hypothetical protein